MTVWLKFNSLSISYGMPQVQIKEWSEDLLGCLQHCIKRKKSNGRNYILVQCDGCKRHSMDSAVGSVKQHVTVAPSGHKHW